MIAPLRLPTRAPTAPEAPGKNLRFGVATGIAVCLVYPGVLRAMGDASGAKVVIGTVIAIVLAYALAHRLNNFLLGVNLSVFAAYCGIMTRTARQGGFEAPTLRWLVTGPALSMIGAAYRSAIVWLAPRAFSPRDIAEGVGALFAAQAAVKGLELTCRLAPTVAEQVYGDAARLRKILSNLVGNAIKLTAQGSVTLEVTQHGAEFCFEISDTGIGILQSQQAILFSPFTQLDDSVTRTREGTRLGLAISRELAALRGGGIELLSVAGRERGSGAGSRSARLPRSPRVRCDAGWVAQPVRSRTSWPRPPA